MSTSPPGGMPARSTRCTPWGRSSAVLVVAQMAAMDPAVRAARPAWSPFPLRRPSSPAPHDAGDAGGVRGRRGTCLEVRGADRQVGAATRSRARRGGPRNRPQAPLYARSVSGAWPSPPHGAATTTATWRPESVWAGVRAPPGGLECGSGLRFHGRGPSCPESSFPLTTLNEHTDGPALPRTGTTGESRGRPGPNVRSGWRGPVPATYQRARDGADPVLEESHLSPSTPTSRKPPLVCKPTRRFLPARPLSRRA